MSLLPGAWGPSSELPPTESIDGDSRAGKLEGAPGESRGMLERAPFGRYLGLEKLGSGGMGTVFAAYDPQLERKVALKVLRARQAHERDRARLVREARALARLTHPNVVTIHEVGTVEDELYLAMELVEGRTLAQWQAAKGRSWAEILRCYLSAGRGLAAAHAKGLIHRDFKPSNVMVGDDGRVRVMDFGLARFVGAEDELITLSPPGASEELERTQPLTRASSMIGTPAYMAPEQFERLVADAHTDQFSFCVALWEAIYRSPAFAGRDLSALRAAVLAGRISDLPPSKVPASVEAALRRGLEYEPEHRWPSMVALLGALESALAPRAWWRRPAVATFVTVALIGGLAGVFAQGRAEQGAVEQLCSGAAAKIEPIWNPARAASIEARVEAGGDAVALETWRLQRARIDDYARGWVLAHTDTCEATWVRGEQSEAAMQLRMDCLGRARLELQATTAVLEQLDARSMRGVYELVNGLPALGDCEQVESSSADLGPPSAAPAQAVEGVRSSLALARARVRAGHYEKGRELAQAALDEVRALNYDPLETASLQALAGAQAGMGDHTTSIELLREAQRSAARSSQWVELIESTASLVFALGHEKASFDQAELAASVALGVVENTRAPLAEARLRQALGAAHLRSGHVDEAIAAFESTLRLRRTQLDDNDLRIAGALNNLGAAYGKGGELGQARKLQLEALELRRQALGPNHPLVGRSLHNLASVSGMLGEFTEAQALAEQAVDVLETSLGHEHIESLGARITLATTLAQQEQYEATERELRAVIEAWERSSEPDHPELAMARTNYATVLAKLGQLEQAREQLRSGLAALQRSLGPDHPRVATLHNNLAETSIELGRFEEARSELGRALEIWSERLGPTHPRVALAHQNIGRVLVELGRVSEAEQEFVLAVELSEAGLGEGHPKLAVARLRLAEFLVEQGRTSEARDLLDAAWSVLEHAGIPSEKARAAEALARVRD